MISEITVNIKGGSILTSKYYDFSFHGLSLHGNAVRFFQEKAELTCTELENPKHKYYFPYENINHIEELFI